MNDDDVKVLVKCYELYYDILNNIIYWLNEELSLGWNYLEIVRDC